MRRCDAPGIRIPFRWQAHNTPISACLIETPHNEGTSHPNRDSKWLSIEYNMVHLLYAD